MEGGGGGGFGVAGGEAEGDIVLFGEVGEGAEDGAGEPMACKPWAWVLGRLRSVRPWK